MNDLNFNNHSNLFKVIRIVKTAEQVFSESEETFPETFQTRNVLNFNINV